MEKSTISIVVVTIIVAMVLVSIETVSALDPEAFLVVATHGDNRVLKLDPGGNIIWDVDVGSYSMDVAINPIDRTIYVLSYNNLFKLDSDGNTLWSTDISFMIVPGAGGPADLDINPNDGSAYIIALGGVSHPFGLHKYDSNGNYVWYRQVDFQGVAVNYKDGSVYVNGYTQGVFKYDPDGNLIWQTDTGPWSNAYAAYSIAVDSSDGSTVAIHRYGGPVTKLDADGNILWETYTTADKWGVALDSRRNAVYVVGSGYLHKLDLTSGSLIWEQSISGTTAMVAVNSMDGSVYVSGTWDYTLYNVDPDGNILWTKNLGYIVYPTSFLGRIPVGGIWVSINKFELLAPWISLVSLVTTTFVSVVYLKRKKKQQN